MKIIDDNLINGVAEQAKQSPIAARMVLTFLKTYGMVWNVWSQAFCWNARKVRLLNMR